MMVKIGLSFKTSFHAVMQHMYAVKFLQFWQFFQINFLIGPKLYLGLKVNLTDFSKNWQQNHLSSSAILTVFDASIAARSDNVRQIRCGKIKPKLAKLGHL